MTPNLNRRRSEDLRSPVVSATLDMQAHHEKSDAATSPSLEMQVQQPMASEASRPSFSDRKDLPIHLSMSKNIRLMQEPRLFSEAELDERKIIYPEMSDRRIVNVFRDIRTKLLQVSRGQNFVGLVVPSCSRAGGTLFSLNLAASIAFDDSKTALVIDCNLRNPSLHKILDIEPEFDLVDFLENEDLDIDKVIYSSGIPRLRVIPVGSRKESGGEAFTSLRMQAFLDVLKSRYPDRYIILDGPSLDDSADARILAELCDLATIVVPYGLSTTSEVIDAANAIGKSKLAGVVMNYT